MSTQIKVGITHGDINGISYEILLKTFSDNRLLELFSPVIYGSAKAAAYHRKVIDCKPLIFNMLNHPKDARENAINFVNVIEEEVKIDLGQPSAEVGKAAFIALDRATTDLVNEDIDVLVTLPINKDSIQHDDFDFPGHTEFLQSRANSDDEALMILACDTLRVALVSTHIPIAEVPQALSKTTIINKIKALDFSLRRDFNIDNPRIAVLGLNPHAGENGLLGSEEIDCITPAVQACINDDILCAGPFAADGFFGVERYKDFDGVLAMYHDQGLIPFKTIAMDKGVNFTAGLPFVRTSPDHGTGYDIAGKNKASEESFREAIYMAMDIWRNRKAYDEARVNPLRKTYVARGNDNEKLDLTAD